MKKLFFLFFILTSVFSVYSQQDISLLPPTGTIQLRLNDIVWMDAPPTLPAGSKIAVLEGNPKQEGIFTIRAMFPQFSQIPVHSHPKDERVTVISGVVYVGFGDKIDGESMRLVKIFTQGCYYLNPAGANHFVYTDIDTCVIQITGLGPWEIDYLETNDEKK